MSMKKRLELLASAQEASQTRLDSRAGNDLAEQCRALCVLLPDAERAVIESRGAAGYAELMESYWMTASTGEDFTRQAALIAYRDAAGRLKV